MVLPLIPLVAIAVGAATGGGGLALGGKGAYDIKKASSELTAAKEQYEARHAQSTALVAEVNVRVADYGKQQDAALRNVVVRMHDFLIRNEKKVRDNEKLLVDGIEAHVQLVAGPNGVNMPIGDWIRGIVGSIGTTVGVGAATTTAVTSFGAASTGAAIAGLSGAAAESATLAWLGGGSLAAGGGGMALGAVALNFVAIGPGLLAAGFMVNGQGKKAVTQARAFRVKIAGEIENLNIADTKVSAVRTRTDELSDILRQITSQAVSSLDLLESEPFNPQEHAGRFQQSMILVKGVLDVARTPVIDKDGSLTEAGHHIAVKYRAADTSQPQPEADASAVSSPDTSVDTDTREQSA